MGCLGALGFELCYELLCWFGRLLCFGIIVFVFGWCFVYWWLGLCIFVGLVVGFPLVKIGGFLSQDRGLLELSYGVS